MNAYSTEFFAQCPNNGVRIKYSLRIETASVVSVEEILAAVDLIDQKFHEEIADDLFGRFGGRQTLRAHHHGVDIETVRSAA